VASIQRVRVRGRTYWRIVESRRVDGKPRPVPILHLGTADGLRDRLLEPPQGQPRIRSFQHGDVAALKAVADRLNVVPLIDRHVGGARRQLSVGRTLLLLAIERAIRPRSGRGLRAWAARTSLHRLLPGLDPNAPRSRSFWDRIERVEPETWRSIADDITRAVVAELGIELDTLLYDATGFSTHIASANPRPKPARRGRAKQKRTDLRPFGLTVLVSRKEGIPLCSRP
jgi:transposase